MAPDLRDRCALRDVHLVAGEAEEILVEHARSVAKKLGITESTALQNYVDADALDRLVAAVVGAGTTYAKAASSAAPIEVSATELGAVVAALGMAVKLAAEALEDPTQSVSALGLITDAADAFVGLGVVLRGAVDHDKAIIEGPALVYARSVLQVTVRHLRDRSWACSCHDQHVVGQPCSMQDMLLRDLGLIGAWSISEHEPPAGER